MIKKYIVDKAFNMKLITVYSTKDIKGMIIILLYREFQFHLLPTNYYSAGLNIL